MLLRYERTLPARGLQLNAALWLQRISTFRRYRLGNGLYAGQTLARRLPQSRPPHCPVFRREHRVAVTVASADAAALQVKANFKKANPPRVCPPLKNSLSRFRPRRA